MVDKPDACRPRDGLRVAGSRCDGANDALKLGDDAVLVFERPENCRGPPKERR